MFQKFIVNQGRLKLAVVDQHYQISDNHNTTQGGGWWHMDQTAKTIWLYGKSQLFGAVSREALQKVIKEGNHDYPGFTFYYSSSTSLWHAIELGEPLN